MSDTTTHVIISLKREFKYRRPTGPKCLYVSQDGEKLVPWLVVFGTGYGRHALYPIGLPDFLRRIHIRYTYIRYTYIYTPIHIRIYIYAFNIYAYICIHINIYIYAYIYIYTQTYTLFISVWFCCNIRFIYCKSSLYITCGLGLYFQIGLQLFDECTTTATILHAHPVLSLI